jgi:hypothetical protein
VTDWTSHHPSHDHPDFDVYLDSLSDDDIAAINDAITHTASKPPDPGAEPTPDNDPDHSEIQIDLHRHLDKLVRSCRAQRSRPRWNTPPLPAPAPAAPARPVPPLAEQITQPNHTAVVVHQPANRDHGHDGDRHEEHHTRPADRGDH